ncbi:MAG: hypothetical protein M1826_003927 [Phylliscum demangeonii]|nr:MAG: hypothetical protein M1826_003927 [Phylliscum demangeonii]
MCSSDDETFFAPLLERLQRERLPAWGSAARQTLEPGKDAVTCAVRDPPLYGGDHILFVLLFADGARWILRIPATGYREAWDDISAAALQSEALTMRLIRQTTTIPVPEVYAFSDSIDPQLGCAYILLEYVDGVPLHEVWFDRSLGPAALDGVRTRVLTELAAAMQQLSQFSFDRGGAPRYDDSGHWTDVGAMKIRDFYAELDAMNAGEYDEQALPVWSIGPFDDPRDYFRSMWSRRRAAAYPLARDVHELMRLLISWMPGPATGQAGAEAPFVFTHPDFGMQNFLVGRDGGLKAVIDWDGVAAVPRCVGNESYPGWLTRDWEPDYRDPAADPAPDAPTRPENSPDELHRFRTCYLTQMKEAGASGEHTTRSLLWGNVETAVLDPISTMRVMVHVVDKIVAAHVPETGDRLSSDDVIANLEEAEPDGSALRTLRAAFRPWCDVPPEAGRE